MPKVHSKFYYIEEITKDNRLLNFDEGAGELTAQVRIGSYGMSDLANAVAEALNEEGLLEYSVSLDRATRQYTIAANGNFDLLTTSGSGIGQSVFSIIGFVGADKTGVSSYQGDACGVEFLPQFYLQDYIPFGNWVESVSESVNEAASGELEVVTFGQRQLMEFNMTYITDYNQDNGFIKNDQNAVANVLAFLNHCIKKRIVEFMEDESLSNAFDKCLLESTPGSGKGTGFKLNELYSRGLYGFFETGRIKFRKV